MVAPQRKSTQPKMTKPKKAPAQTQRRVFQPGQYPRVIRSDPDQVTSGSGHSAATEAPTAMEAPAMPESFPPAGDIAPAEKKAARRATRAATGDAAIVKAVTELYATMGTVWAFVNQYDGIVIISKADSMAASLVAACKPYPNAMRVLQLIAKGNVWTILIAAHLGPTVAIAANHGILPREAPARFNLPIPPARERDMPDGPAPSSPYVEEMAAMAEQQAEAEQMAAYLRETVAASANGHAAGAAPLGELSEEGDARAAVTQAQMQNIILEAQRKWVAQQQAIPPDADVMPPPEHNPLGWRQG